MNIVSAEFKADPFPVLARLRSEEPIHRTTLPDKTKTPVWLVTRYEDVNALLKDERFPKDRRSATLGVLGSANRDETVFENPNALDITRD